MGLNYAILARQQKIKSSSQKFILVTLGIRANEDGLAFPSLACLVADTCLNRKTIISGMKILAEDGYIRDTGNRKGITQQVKIWELTLSPNRNASVLGTVPEFSSNSAKLPQIPTQNRDKEKTGITHNKTSSYHANNLIAKSKSTNPQWWKSDSGTIDMGKMIGLEARSGESIESFRHRIFAAR